MRSDGEIFKFTEDLVQLHIEHHGLRLLFKRKFLKSWFPGLSSGRVLALWNIGVGTVIPILSDNSSSEICGFLSTLLNTTCVGSASGCITPSITLEVGAA